MGTRGLGSRLSLGMPVDAGSHSGASGIKCFEVPQLKQRPTEGPEAPQPLDVSRWALKE